MKDIQTAIENLYVIFGKYTTEGIHHCDCGCIDTEDVRKLNSKPLRQLQEDDLIHYHGSALYTWGDIEHYKHYLPRICELRSLNRNYAFINLDELFAKLEYAKWTHWLETEQQAIKEYVATDWVYLTNMENSEIRDRELSEYGKFIEISELLKHWNIFTSNNSLRNFVFFFYYHGSQILNGGVKINDERHEEFIGLIKTREFINKLEDEFFQNETTDPNYAEKISIVLQVIEQELKIRNIR